MDSTTNNVRPTLYDPIEYATIKEIYFKDNLSRTEFCEDPIERLERMESKHRNLTKNSR